MSYIRIEKNETCEITEKKSRFIAYLAYVTTEEDAQSFVAQIKKKHYDARHNVYAYILNSGGKKYSDDGEPSKTAGYPILEMLENEGVTDVVCVVTRYFGGTLLGTGGLIVAYRTAAADAIEHCKIETRLVEEKITYTFTYPMMNDVMKVVKDMQPRIISQTFDNTCSITLSIRKSEAEALRGRLAKLSF